MGFWNRLLGETESSVRQGMFPARGLLREQCDRMQRTTKWIAIA
jgi:hypothetical protein